MSDQFVPPRLRTVLKTYQNSATKSLQGPGLTLIHPHKKEIESPESGDEHLSHMSPMPPPPAPIILPHPILTAPDSRTGVLQKTLIEGKPIGSFELGGEMRLCLAQFLNDVLTDFGMDQINRVFDELRIFCSQCTPEQLQEFKHAKIIPKVVSSCGLITRTNAERLCSALLHLPERPCNIKGSISFKVYHRCFGKCEGICTPELYSLKEPACIQCIECSGFFSPQRFVCHVHRQENETCHWGFDSSNWRDYIHVNVDEQNREKFEKLLDALKDREREELEYLEIYLRKREHLKRKTLDDSALSPQSTPLITEDIPSIKKQKLSPEEFSLEMYHHQQIMAANMRYSQMPAAFRPWALQQQLAAAAAARAQPPQQSPTSVGNAAAAAGTNLNPKRRIQMLPFNAAINPEGFVEPPILQNPDKVVRMTDSQTFQSSLQPNVALAPRKMVTIKEQHQHHHHHHHHESREKEERNGSRDRPPSIDRTINIKTEPQIKQEPPGTPPDMIQSPEIRYSPAGTTTPHHRVSGNVTPGSPTEVSQSGSNEITSSTSPVPAITHDTNTIIKKQESLSPPPSQQPDQELHTHRLHHNHQILHAGAVAQQTGIVMHHHHHPTMGQIRRGTPIPTENIHHRSQQLSVSPPTTKMNGVVSTMVGSELELSTDTDDESIAGEPDSSNTPYEIPSEFLKDVRPDHREKLINVIKALVQENVVSRQENEQIRSELQRKCDQFEELLQKYKVLQQQFDQEHHQYHDISNNRQLISSGGVNATPAGTTLEPSVITTKRPEINNFNNNDHPSSPMHHLIERRNGYSSTTENNKTTSEIIIKPFKKSLRRSPEETVVIMQPKREGEIKILTNGELVRSTVN